MRIINLLIPTFVIYVGAIAQESQQSNGVITAASQVSGAIAPARTMDFTPEYPSTADPDLDPSVGTDEEGPPDAEDDAWVSAFLDGEPVDALLDFDTHDLVANEDCDPCDDDTDETNGVSNATSIAALTKQRALTALAQAHYRARLRTAGLSYTGSAEPEDQQWAATFFSGADVDPDLIWDATNLDDPADSSSDDVALLSAADFTSGTAEAAALAASSNSTAASAIAKRIHYKHPPRNALQVLRRFQRAGRRARHRARVRRHLAAVRRHKRAAHANKVRYHHLQVTVHKTAEGQRKEQHNMNHAANRILHAKPTYPDATHKANGQLRHGVKKCGHRTAPGTECNGSINCHWWCVRGIQNCGFDSAC